MPDPQPPSSRRLSDACRRAAARTRPAHVAVLGAVAISAFGLVGLRSVELPGPQPIEDGDRLRIEVVQPIEPKVSPGAVMEVGQLVDGFTHVPPPPPAEPMPAAYAPHDEWEEGLPRAPRQPRFGDEASSYPPQPPEPRAERGGGWFGFDAPRRDYQAEREARRDRLDALERREREAALQAGRDEERRRWRDRPPEREPATWWD